MTSLLDTARRLVQLGEAATSGPWMQATHVDAPEALVTKARPNESLLGLDVDGMAIFMNKHDCAMVAAARDADRLASALIEAEALIRSLRDHLDPRDDFDAMQAEARQFLATLHAGETE